MSLITIWLTLNTDSYFKHKKGPHLLKKKKKEINSDKAYLSQYLSKFQIDLL